MEESLFKQELKIMTERGKNFRMPNKQTRNSQPQKWGQHHFLYLTDKILRSILPTKESWATARGQVGACVIKLTRDFDTLTLEKESRGARHVVARRPIMNRGTFVP